MRLRLLPFGFILSVLVALCAGLPTRTFAQAGTSGLTGTVTDPSGTAMDRVHIVVVDPATGFSRETDTNNTGRGSWSPAATCPGR